ncbi:MTH938/NDUFAF3 family protein, partial [Klebsiella aerogenes]|uniref:MTH938/NDUFAF3 family protein n=1 Tax=Klebsiella aerogenes TaxID=548 RepID=UPI0019544536
VIDAYGRGGFRFAEMSHRGSILALPSGIHAWEVASHRDFTPEAFVKVVAERAAIDVLLIGAGDAPFPVPEEIRWT